MKFIGIIAVISTVLLTSCSNNEFLKDIKGQTVQIGEDVGLIEVSTMKKPSYYSTKQIESNYEFGKSYEIRHLDCSSSFKSCN